MQFLKLTKPWIRRRGLDYREEGRVLECTRLRSFVWAGLVKGSTDEPYEVFLDENDPARCSCTCPYAEQGSLCKHMAALAFEAQPELIREYFPEEWELLEWKRRFSETGDRALRDAIVRAVCALPELEVRVQLCAAVYRLIQLGELPDFVRGFEEDGEEEEDL